MVECSFTNKVVVGSNPVAVSQTSDMALVLSKEFLDIQATIECRFTLKLARDMLKTYSQRYWFSISMSLAITSQLQIL